MGFNTIKRGLVPVVTMVTVGFLYTNCAQVKHTAPAPASATSQVKSTVAPAPIATTPTTVARAPASLPAPAAPLAAANSGVVSCQDSELYSCISQTFGKDVVAGTASGQFECVTLSDGTYICPSGEADSYNSAAAQINCAQRNCTENFEYVEYICHLKLAGHDANSPSFSDLSSAVQHVYDSCQKTVAAN